MKNLKNLLDFAYENWTEHESKETKKLFLAWLKKAKLIKKEENINYMEDDNEYGMIPGYGGYDHMEGLKQKWRTVTASLGDRPYVWYAYSLDKTRLLQYCEWDIMEREIH